MRKSIVVIAILFASLTVQAQDVEIPFTMNACNHPVVRTTIRGKEVVLVIDTGSTYTQIDRRFKLLQENGQLNIFLTESDLVTVRAIFANYKPLRKTCGGGDGVIGQDVLSAYHSITFDYENHVLILRR